MSSILEMRPLSSSRSSKYRCCGDIKTCENSLTFLPLRDGVFISCPRIRMGLCDGLEKQNVAELILCEIQTSLEKPC